MKLLKLLILLTFVSCSETVFVDVEPQLELVVIDSIGNYQADASVDLFETEDDFYVGKNSINSGYTDNNGTIEFEELEEKVYYFYVEKGELNNYYDVVTFSNPLNINEKRKITCTIN